MTDQQQPVQRTYRPVEPHRYACLDCRVTMSTDNPIPDLVLLWRVHHMGHNVTEEHDPEPDAATIPASGVEQSGSSGGS